MNKKKIFISLQKIIDIGGISTSVLNLLNEIHGEYDITLCTTENYISPHVNIPTDVHILNGSSIIGDSINYRTLLSEQNIVRKLWRMLVRLMRRILGMRFIVDCGMKQIKVPNVTYDAAIAFSNDIYSNGKLSEGGDYDLIIHKVKAKRKVAWMHNDLQKEGYDHDICLRAFRDFDAIVNVSKDNKALFDSVIPEYAIKSHIVYNTYDINRIINSAQEPNPYRNDGKLHLVTVARVGIRQKRIDRIVETCKRLKEDDISNFTWTIVGDGVERASLEKLSLEYGLTDILKFVGLKTNPYPYMYYADAFVLSSLYEGLPMTIMEAKILCCPILTTNFGSAIEAVKDGFEGRICDNSTEGVYEMVKNVLQSPEELKSYRNYLKDHPITNEVAIAQFKEVCGL